MLVTGYEPPPSAKEIVATRDAAAQRQNNLSKSGGGKIEYAGTGSPKSDANVGTTVELLSRMEKVDDAQSTRGMKNARGGRRSKRKRRRRTFRRRRRR